MQNGPSVGAKSCTRIQYSGRVAGSADRGSCHLYTCVSHDSLTGAACKIWGHTRRPSLFAGLLRCQNDLRSNTHPARVECKMIRRSHRCVCCCFWVVYQMMGSARVRHLCTFAALPLDSARGMCKTCLHPYPRSELFPARADSRHRRSVKDDLAVVSRTN